MRVVIENTTKTAMGSAYAPLCHKLGKTQTKNKLDGNKMQVQTQRFGAQHSSVPPVIRRPPQQNMFLEGHTCQRGTVRFPFLVAGASNSTLVPSTSAALAPMLSADGRKACI
eukprot:CAMPEP_0183496806 /NCGR_PEP_ID=MMETSP0370-20130417/185134_1 /TAXON_ID=268820 /ORGANISM="Peridinium aciculiferum, Strain PAER-2" /LENGTH=111 /DNA_ID=CAMNT_0025690151 /DNA_START=746 /DNA_END=1078 /DNA_ORIENTATION=+